MSLPDDFSPAQHLLSMLIGTHNRSVQQTFLGVPDQDLEHPLGGMKLACLIEPDDTVDMILLRLFLYWFEFKGNLPAPIYGIPVDDYQADLQIPFKPQVTLFFVESYSAFLAENKLRPARARISWRIMSQTSQTINQSYATSLGLRIKEVFAINNGFTWERGTVKVVYHDKERGCDFRLLAESQGEAIRVISTVLEVAEIPFEESRINVSNSLQSFPVIPQTQEVYGKTLKKPRKRPITQVKFTRAELNIYGLPQPVVLVDRLNSGYALVN